MGFMKKRVLLILALFVTTCAQTRAAITVEQATEPEYIINNGYSEAFAEEVNLVKNRVNGKPAEPLYNKNRNGVVRFCKNIWGYLDPSVDTEERIHHDIHMSPSWKDL